LPCLSGELRPTINGKSVQRSADTLRRPRRVVNLQLLVVAIVLEVADAFFWPAGRCGWTPQNLEGGGNRSGSGQHPPE